MPKPVDVASDSEVQDRVEFTRSMSIEYSKTQEYISKSDLNFLDVPYILPNILNSSRSSRVFEILLEKKLYEKHLLFEFSENNYPIIIARCKNEEYRLTIDPPYPKNKAECQKIVNRVILIRDGLAVASQETNHFKYFTKSIIKPVKKQSIEYLQKLSKIIYRTSVIRNEEIYQISMTAENSDIGIILTLHITSGKEFSQKIKIDMNTVVKKSGLSEEFLIPIGIYLCKHVLKIDEGICYFDFARSQLNPLEMVTKIQAFFRGTRARKICKMIGWNLLIKERIILSRKRHILMMFKHEENIMIRIVRGADVLGINLTQNAIYSAGYFNCFENFFYEVVYSRIKIVKKDGKDAIAGLDRYAH